MSRLKTLRDENARKRYEPNFCRCPSAGCDPALRGMNQDCRTCPHGRNNLPKLWHRLSGLEDE